MTPSLTLLHSDVFPIARYADALTRESIAPRRLTALDQLLLGDTPGLRVVLIDLAIVDGDRQTLALDTRTAVVGVGLAEQPRWLSDESVYLGLPKDPTDSALLGAIKRAFQFLYQKQRADQLERQLSERTRELQQVAEVGAALSTVRDHSVLLTMILGKARELSRADAGSLYLLDEVDRKKVLRWKLAQNDSIDVEAFEERILPITRKSLAGYVAMTGEMLVIDDAYNLPAGVAVENNLLYESIERLFEGFVTAAVTAIEQRDPTTSGHSFRVADLTVELARVVDHMDAGEYRDVHFTGDQVREIRYASLLHDFGKVGVREQVLVKEKKLYPHQIEIVRGRFEFVMKSVENEANRKKIDYLLQHGRDGYDAFSSNVDAELQSELDRLQKDFAFIAQSNEPTVLPEGDFNYLRQLATLDFTDIRGERRLLLDPEEARILSIRKGNLDATERIEIESHVTHTFNFLQKIPWTRDLASVADIAYAHHEKLNGRGYPRKLTAGGIPIQSRMMTVSDIYDALTASDRPYKRAVPTERALDILRMEMNDGLLDPALVGVFIEAKVYERAGVLRT